MTQCPNCATPLEATDQFCGQCGQKTHQHRFTLPHIFHELFHAFTHADKGVFLLLRDLALRPGRVLREYIIEFKRAKYFNPFTFLLLVLGFWLFVNSVVKPYSRELAATTTPSVTTGVRPAADQARATRRRQSIDLVEKRSNLAALFALPLTAFVFWLFYRRLNYAEHMVAQVLLGSFYVLLGSLLLFLALIPAFRWFATTWGQFAIHGTYFTWAYYQFLGGNRPASLLKIILATLLSIVAWAIFSGGLIFLYIAFG